MDVASALSGIPAGLRSPLIDAFREIIKNYREGRWEPSELNGGKLCEVVYSILRGHVDGKMPPRPRKPPNMVDACKGLEKANPAMFPRSVRIQIPRMLVALYEIRNNRGVGHVGGDVDPNQMDAKVVVEMAKWMMAELVRVFHDVGTDEAGDVVDALAERTVPVVWSVDGRRRVLNSSLSMKDQMLLLLYSANGPVSEENLVNWVEHSSASIFRRDVIWPAHRTRLIEYSEDSRDVRISPTGIVYVEENLPLEV